MQKPAARCQAILEYCLPAVNDQRQQVNQRELAVGRLFARWSLMYTLVPFALEMRKRCAVSLAFFWSSTWQ